MVLSVDILAHKSISGRELAVVALELQLSLNEPINQLLEVVEVQLSPFLPLLLRVQSLILVLALQHSQSPVLLRRLLLKVGQADISRSFTVFRVNLSLVDRGFFYF